MIQSQIKFSWKGDIILGWVSISKFSLHGSVAAWQSGRVAANKIPIYFEGGSVAVTPNKTPNLNFLINVGAP